MQPAPEHRLAATALARGDALTALNTIGGDVSPHGRALRGIALAQLQELESAQRELRGAAEALVDAPVFRARALAALAEVAAARRELGTALDALEEAADRLERLNDQRNALWTRLVRARILVLIGAVPEAQRAVESIAAGLAESPTSDPVLRSTLSLVQAVVAVRTLAAGEALGLLGQALDILSTSSDSSDGSEMSAGTLEPSDGAAHPLIRGELEAHRAALTAPLARLTVAGKIHDLTLPDLATVVRGGDPPPTVLGAWNQWLVIDGIAGRFGFCGEDLQDLSHRPVLLALLVELAREWPHTLPTDTLIARVFEGPPQDASYRERCRVEIGRLRRLLPSTCGIEARGHAWRLRVPEADGVALVELLDTNSPITALLADGQPWAARDLALALGASQRSIQRTLRQLRRDGTVEAIGQARAQRWRATREGSGIATQMFLVSLLDPAETWDSPKPEGGS